MNPFLKLFSKTKPQTSDNAAQMEYDANPGPSVHPYTDDPNKAWQMMVPTRKVKPVTPMKLNTPVYDDKVRFVCMSDTHNQHIDTATLPPGDVFLHGGDFTNVGHLKDLLEFNDFLGKLPYKHKIVIAGNHELTFEGYHSDHDLDRYLKEHNLNHPSQILTNASVFLEDNETTVCGIRVYGSPWQPEFGGWAYNLLRGQALLDKWNMIPDGVDILMTHGPPIGYGDECSNHQRAGCVELLDTIRKRVKPKYHIAGHIHEDYGIRTDGLTTFINASTCTLNYRPTNPPIIFDLALPGGASKLTPPSVPKNDWATENSTENSRDTEGSMGNSLAQMENSTNTEGTGENMENSETEKANLPGTSKTEKSSENTQHSMAESDTAGIMETSKTSEESFKDSENADRCTEEVEIPSGSKAPENDAKSKSNNVMDNDTNSSEDFDTENHTEPENSSSNPKQYSSFFHKPDSDSDDDDDDDDDDFDNEPEWEEMDTFETENFRTEDSILIPSVKPKAVKPKANVMFSNNVVDIDDDSDEDVIAKIDKQEDRVLTQIYEDSLQSKIVVHPCTSNATKAWEMLSVKQTVNIVEPLDLKTPVYPDKVRFVCMSDTHNRVKDGSDLPRGDVFLHAGDFTMEGTVKQIQQFNDFLGK